MKVGEWMQCHNCQANNPEDAKYCKACGESLTTFQRMMDLNYKGRTQRYSEEEFERRASAKAKTRKKKASDVETDAGMYGEGAAFNPVKRSETFEYTGTQRATVARSKNSPAFLVSLYVSLALAAVNFVLPFFAWMSYRLTDYVSGTQSLFGLLTKFFGSNDMVSFLAGFDVDSYYSSMLPGELNGGFFAAKIIAIVIAGLFAVGLIFYLIFIILAAFRLRSSGTLGIMAAVFTIIADVVILVSLSVLNIVIANYDIFQWNLVSFTPTVLPWISIALSVVIIIMSCVIKVTGRKE